MALPTFSLPAARSPHPVSPIFATNFGGTNPFPLYTVGANGFGELTDVFDLERKIRLVSAGVKAQPSRKCLCSVTLIAGSAVAGPVLSNRTNDGDFP